ncbi:MAG: deoxyguanosinetriphosphate triphosphohydrolase, partial [Clostridia bacterium]
LNLTFEVRNGISTHKYADNPATLEGHIVKYVDRFAYINHDIEDAIRGGILSETDLPKDCVDTIGHSKSERINNLILDLVQNSFGQNFIKQTPTFQAATEKLHKFMFDAVYLNDKAKHEKGKAKDMLAMVYNYYLKNLDQLPEFYVGLLKTTPPDRVVCDYVSSFTDRYCVKTFKDLFIPGEWQIY